MAWTPIAETGISFTLSDFATSGSVTMVGSIITGAGATTAAADDDLFTFNVDTDLPVRLTAQSYTTQAMFNGDLYFPAFCLGQVNEAAPYPSSSWVGNDAQTAWEPATFEVGGTYYTCAKSTGDQTPCVESFQFLVEVDIDVPPPPAATCEEPGRETRCYVSGYNRSRVHDSRLWPREKRCLVADFNGAIPPARKIVSVSWRMESAFAVAMSDASIAPDGRSARVMIQAAWPGCAFIRAQVTLDNGEVYPQLFRVIVLSGPYFGDTSPVGGPIELTATATP